MAHFAIIFDLFERPRQRQMRVCYRWRERRQMRASAAVGGGGGWQKNAVAVGAANAVQTASSRRPTSLF